MTRLPSVLLAPVILGQAARLRATIPRLPEPPGPRAGVAQRSAGGAVGDSPRSRVLIIGDSTAVGTGADSPATGVAGRLAAALGTDAPPVAWTVLGRNGATSADVRRDLLPSALADRSDPPIDVAVVMVGWNDALALRSSRRFGADLAAIARELGAARMTRRVVIVEPPHFERFAAVPQPLRWALGAHAAGLRRVAARVGATWGMPVAPGFDGGSTAGDGFHPDADGYARLTAGIVQVVRRAGFG